ncbi:DUF4352 domain-containing protein [bacterium]|nr:DUF4352 domain-containing protein [bacterium]
MGNIIVLLYIIGAIALIFITLFIIGLLDPKIVRCYSRIGVFWCYGTFFLASTIVEVLIFNALEIPLISYRTNTIYVAHNYQRTSTSFTHKKGPAIRKKKITSIGQTINTKHMSYSVKSFSFRNTVGNSNYGISSTADGIYLIVNISLKNLTDTPCTLPTSNFCVVDKNGMKYTFQDYATTLFKISENIMSAIYEAVEGKNFQPNVPTKEYLLFEVPQRDTYYLYLEGSSTMIILE